MSAGYPPPPFQPVRKEMEMSISDYEHWNEEAPIIWAQENDFDSPYCDMTDEEIKQSVYERDAYEDD